MNIDLIDFQHKKCLTIMKRKLEPNKPEKTGHFYLYECPKCHYFITCNIQELDDTSIEIQNVCENCNNNMNVLPDYVTPQRGIIFYRCQTCGQEIILHTLKPF